MAVHAANTVVHVAWIEADMVDSKIRHRRRDAAGNWSPPLGTAGNLVGSTGSFNSTYVEVEIAVDSLNQPHIACILENPSGPFTTQDIQYSFNLGPLTNVPGTHLNDTAQESESGLRIKTDPGNVPHIAYSLASTPSGHQVRYTNQSGAGGSWLPIESVSPVTGATEGDFDVESAVLQHFTYVGGAIIRYRKRTGPNTYAPEQVVSGASLAGSPVPRIVVDSRGQPHITYGIVVAAIDRLAYAARVANGFLSYNDAQPWPGRQEPIPELLVNSGGYDPSQNDSRNVLGIAQSDIAVNRNDAVYVTARPFLFARQIEPNLGEEDAFATFSGGPNASLHLANGNVAVQIPLFASRGAGFATSPSLVYNSQEWDPGFISQGWILNYQIALTDCRTDDPNLPPPQDNDNKFIVLTLGDGRSLFFRFNSSLGTFLADDDFGYFSKLERDLPAAGLYRLTTKFGVTYDFRSDGKLRALTDPHTNTFVCSYGGDADVPAGTPAGLLGRIRDTMNRPTDFLYDASGRLSEVRDPATRRYLLEYNAASGKLEFVLLPNPSGGTTESSSIKWKMTYWNANSPLNQERVNLLSRLDPPRGVAGGYGWTFQWQQDNRIARTSDPSELSITDETNIDALPGAVVGSRTIAYTDPAPPFADPATATDLTSTSLVKATLTNRRGYRTQIVHEQKRTLAWWVRDEFHIANPSGSVKPIQRTFDGFRNLTAFKDKKDQSTTYTYHATATPSHVKDNLATLTRPGVPAVSYTYTTDSLNRVASVTDAGGNTTSYAYNGAGDLTRITYPPVTLANGDSQTASEDFTYDGMGRLTTSASAELRTTQFLAFDATSGLVTSILRSGHLKPEQFLYDTLGNTTQHTLPEGGSTSFDLDPLYRVTRRTDPPSDAGNSMTDFLYDADSNLTDVLSPITGGTTTTRHAYDKLGRLMSTTQQFGTPSAATADFTYDRQGNTRKQTDFKGTLATKSLFDALDRSEEEQRNISPTLPTPSTLFTKTRSSYDPNGNLTQRTDFGDFASPPLPNRIASYTYDARNNADVTTQADGTTLDNDYDVTDNLTQSIHFSGATFLEGTANEYDQRHRLRCTRRLQSATLAAFSTCYLYDRDNNRIAVLDPLGKATKFVFDAAHRLIQTQDGNCVPQNTLLYDDDDRRIEVRVPDPTTGGAAQILSQRLEYTLKGELKRLFDATGIKIEQNEYDIAGNLLRRTDAAGTQTKFTYDPLSRLIEEKQDEGGLNLATAYAYDANGNRTQITDPGGKVYLFTYTLGNQLEKLTYPPIGGTSNSETWKTNVFAETREHTDANGKVATYAYDAMGRPLTETHGAPFNKTLTRAYTLAGPLDTIDDGTIKIDYDYDVFQRTTHVSWFLSGTLFKEVAYGYDDSGNRVSMTGAQGESLFYDYDIDNRLVRLARLQATNLLVAAQIAYDAAGRKKSVTLGNGLTLLYRYDPNERLVSLQSVKSDGSALLHADYTYDARGNRTQLIHHALQSTVDFGYDPLERLTSENGAGNGAFPSTYTNSFTSNGGNEGAPSLSARVTPAAPLAVPAFGSTYTYDSRGNRTQRNVTPGTPDIPAGLTSYVYDDENRLTTETPPPPAASIAYGHNANGNRTSRIQASTTETYGYDYANRQSSYVKQVSGSTTSSFTYLASPTGDRASKQNTLSGQQFWYMYDGADVTAEYEKVGSTYNLLQTYVQDLAIDAKFVRIDASGAMHYYVGDALGSVVNLVSSTQGIENTQLTNAWGQDLLFSQTVPDRYGFTHRERDEESSLMHFRARSYDPRLGRFVQKDPRNTVIDHYLYASARPLSLVDPTGNAAWPHLANWSGTWIQRYRNYVQNSIGIYKGLSEDCCDLTLKMIVDFAAQNNLPLRFIDNNQTAYKSWSRKYTSKQDFLNTVLQKIGSDALFRTNTSDVTLVDYATVSTTTGFKSKPFTEAKPGDVLVKSDHTAIVVGGPYLRGHAHPDQNKPTVPNFPGHAIAESQPNQLDYFGPTTDKESWQRSDVSQIRVDILNHRSGKKPKAEHIRNRSINELYYKQGLNIRFYSDTVLQGVPRSDFLQEIEFGVKP